MERMRMNGSRLLGLALGLMLAALPVLAFAQTSGDDGSAAAALIGGGFSCVCGLIELVVAIAIAFWVYNDAKKRGNPNAVIWAIVGFFLTLIGLLLYILIGRNQGTTPPAGPTGPSTTARY